MCAITISQALSEAHRKLKSVKALPLDAERLLAHVLNLSRTSLHIRSERVLSQVEYYQFQCLLERMILGEPLAHILGEQPFWSCVLKVIPSVLVPRFDTELLVEKTLQVCPADQKLCVLELGTGSGAIAIALALERPQWQIIATDCSKDALSLAQENAKNLGVSQIEFLRSDWFEKLRAKKFDIIISNPPYVESDILEEDHHLRFEPKVALEGGKDGLESIRLIIKEAGDHLNPGGVLLLEHGAFQGESVRTLFKEAGYKDIQTAQDLNKLDRVTYGFASDSKYS